jgi:IclR family transcriptional regulator, acetate operon repressor
MATGTQSVDRAAVLLVSITQATGPVTFTDLQMSSGLAKSTLSRMLNSLESHGLVARHGGHLRPGPVLTGFARSYSGFEDVIAIAQPHLEVLSEVSGETINLAVRDGFDVQQISQIDCQFLFGGLNWVGQPVPLHCSALGKVFLAHGAPLPPGRLERRTPQTITNRAALQEELDQVRAQGWAIADSELEPGLLAIAAPVWGPDDSVLASISVSGPTQRLTNISELTQVLVREADAISDQLATPPAGKVGAA